MSGLLNKLKAVWSKRGGRPAAETEPAAGTGDYVGTILAEYGQDLPEERQIGATLQQGIALANAGKWQEAAERFRDVMAEQYDYDVPHLWLADCLKQEEGVFAAVESLEGAARVCRRKSYLLGKAAEMGLLEMGWTSDFVELFAQAIAALPARPGPRDYAQQRPFLFLGEICAAFGDDDGVTWTRRVAAATALNADMRAQIHRAIRSDPNYADSFYIAEKVRRLRAALEQRFPA